MYRVGMIADAVFRPGLELMTYLDGNLSSNGLDDPALGIHMFHLPWWTSPNSPTGNPSYLSSATIKSALNHYQRELTAAMKPFGAPHRIRNLADELNKPAYTWHSSVNASLPNSPNNCTRCRLYRAVAVGVMDQLRDTYNMVHACEIANGAEKDIAIRRASGFNELFEAALRKECDPEGGSGSGESHGQESGSESEGKGKEKERFGPEVEELISWTKKLVKEGASSKWTWGVDLTEDDLRGLIRGADRQYQVPHSGYDRDLPSASLTSKMSEALDALNLEDPHDDDLRFDELSKSITIIPELRLHEIPTYSGVLLDPSGDEHIESEPDSVIEAFTKRAKTQATKAKKSLMQDEVDRPVSFLDYGSEFVPQTALIPRRPWLAPRLPIILPPTNLHRVVTDHTRCSDPATEISFPDHIMIPDSDDIPDHITLPESDDTPEHISIPDSDDIPDHLMIPHSGSSGSSQIYFPISDDELSDAMDVVRSDEQTAAPAATETEIPMSVVSSDSESDSILVLPSDPSESPMATRQSTGSGLTMAAVVRDPNTGRFTATSFINFPDDFLD
jgi:hypothetical protein